MTPPIFISYAREDRDFAERLARELSVDGVAVWIDSANISTGEPWDQAIERGLIACSDMLVVLSPDGVNSRSVMNEIAFALERGKRVLPVLYRVCRVPLQIARIQHADFTDSYAVGIATVKRSLVVAAAQGDTQLSTEPHASVPSVPSYGSQSAERSIGGKLLRGAAFGLLIAVVTLVSRFRSGGEGPTISDVLPLMVLYCVIAVVTWSPVVVLAMGHAQRIRWAMVFAVVAIAVTWMAVPITGFVYGVFFSGPVAAMLGALCARYAQRKKSRKVA